MLLLGLFYYSEFSCIIPHCHGNGNGLLRLSVGCFQIYPVRYLPIYSDLFIMKLLFLKQMGSLSKSDPKCEGRKEYILHSKEICIRVLTVFKKLLNRTRLTGSICVFM